MNTGTSDTIRVLVFQEDNMWLAQCVEYDIGAQAIDLTTLQRRFKVTLAADVEESVSRHGTPFKGIDKAPECYERMWEEAEGRFPTRDKATVTPTNSPDVEYEMALCA